MLCSVSRNTFKELTKVWESQASRLMNETLTDSAERGKQLIMGNSLPPDTQNLDVPACFDGSWSTRGLVPRKGVIAAVAENTSHIIEIIFKCNLK